MWGVANSTIAFLLGSFSFFSQAPEQSLIAESGFGPIEGLASQSRSGRTFYEFLGIPYALPPVGSLRFKPPVPWNQTWTEVRDGTVTTPRCVQYHLIARNFNGEEDCLFIYLYTHKFQKVGEDVLPDSELKPVILYIHGGLFMQGSGSFYKPKYFMDEDIVFVSLQYRVGALGFLNLENDEIQGNMGLKDQVAAMTWIKSNAHHFGGDANKLTLMGESAVMCAVSVHLHMLSPMSKGLFHQAISQSGSALVSWGVRDNPVEQAKYFAKLVNCPTESVEEIAKCLQNMDAKKIGRAHTDAATILHHRYALFGPTIEFRDSNATEKFLPDRPENIIKSENFTKVPWIVGCNSHEGILYSGPMVRNHTANREINKNFNYWIPIVFRFVDEPNKEEIATRIREYYFGNVSTEINMAIFPEIVTFNTDRTFMEGLHHTLRLHKGQHPVYPYLYSYRGQFSFGRIMMGMTFNVPVVIDFFFSQGKRFFRTKVLRKPDIDYGVTHGDELPLLFNLPFQDVNEKHPDFELSQVLVKTWTTFAKTGIPPLVKGQTWPDLSVDHNTLAQEGNDKPMRMLKLDKTVEMVDEPFHARADFWKSLNIYPEREYYQ